MGVARNIVVVSATVNAAKGFQYASKQSETTLEFFNN